MKSCHSHHLIVKLLNNIGSTRFAQQNISASLQAFSEALEIQRTYFIEHFGSKPQLDEKELEDLRVGLQSMSFTLQNLAYIHAFIDDQSTSTFFSDTVISINDSLIARSEHHRVSNVDLSTTVDL